MQEEKDKILGNVFISAGANKLRLCNICFSDRIKEITPKSERLFEWNEIENELQRKEIMSQFPLSGGMNCHLLDGRFLLAIPGTIDPHVHFNTPGFEFRDTFRDASLAAAYGGVTTVVDMPCTSIPPVTKLANFESKMEVIRNNSHVDFSFWGGIADDGLDEKFVEKNINELAEAGVAGFKAYLVSGMETFKDLNEEKMRLAAKYVGKRDKTLAVHAEDKQIINSAASKLTKDDLKKWETYCGTRSVLAETEAILKLVNIAGQIRCKIHVVHLSSKDGLEIIKNAQNRKLQITTETCPHYLYFTQEAFKDASIRNYLKTAPPVKSEADKNALWDGLADESIAFVTTDHAGCNPDSEKSSSDFSCVYGGIPGVEHRVPFLFSEGFLRKKINLEQTIRLLSSNAADYFGFTKKGYLKEGCDADIALINLWSSEIVSASNMHSKGRYTPFEGVKFNAVVEKTFLRGNLIMDRLLSLNETDMNPEKLFLGRFIYV